VFAEKKQKDLISAGLTFHKQYGTVDKNSRMRRRKIVEQKKSCRELLAGERKQTVCLEYVPEQLPEDE